MWSGNGVSNVDPAIARQMGLPVIIIPRQQSPKLDPLSMATDSID